MNTYRIHTEADSRSNRRSRAWLIEADSEDAAIHEARMRHIALVRGNPSIWITSVALIADAA